MSIYAGYRFGEWLSPKHVINRVCIGMQMMIGITFGTVQEIGVILFKYGKSDQEK